MRQSSLIHESWNIEPDLLPKRSNVAEVQTENREEHCENHHFCLKFVYTLGYYILLP